MICFALRIWVCGRYTNLPAIEPFWPPHFLKRAGVWGGGVGWAKSLKFLINIFVPMSLRNVAFDIRLICHIWNSTYLCLHARYLSWHATYLCQQCAIAFVFTWAWCNLFISTSCKIIMLTCWHNIYIFGSFSVNTKLSSRPFMDCNIHWGVSIKPEFWTL